MNMTFSYNLTTDKIEALGSIAALDYVANNLITLEFSLEKNCIKDENATFTIAGTAQDPIVVVTPSEPLSTAVYSLQVEYSYSGNTRIDRECDFFDKEDGLKCATYATVMSDSNYLIYEALVSSKDCVECDCAQMCEMLEFLNNKLTEDESTTDCATCH